MRRDAIQIESEVAAPSRARAGRRAFYFEDGSAQFRGDAAGSMFGWYHAAAGVVPRDCVAVLCAPLGPEYARAHRALRHLADRLACAGIPALRFDYPGIGDSAGTDLDPARVASRQAGIRTAIRQAQLLGGRTRVCVIGLSLGATLAALTAVETPVDYLVLWNPCLKMEDDQREIDLLSLSFKVRSRVLCIRRDDMAPDHSLCEHIAASGIATDTMRLPGWAAMMAGHPFNVVPDKALDTIVEWLAAHSDEGPAASPAPSALFRDTMAFAFRGESGVAAVVEEQLCRFGGDEHLAGILSRTSHGTERPAILIFNAGSVHDAGPNRVSVALARNLAAWGFACLRFDAADDVRAAIDCLRHRFGYARFVEMSVSESDPRHDLVCRVTRQLRERFG